jgi:hypothetical protein
MNVSYIDAKQISDIRTLEIYVEAEIFESISEKSRGGRSIEDSEKRLQWFREKLTQRGISRYIGRKRTLKMKQSQTAFRAFLELNTFILNLKKVRTPCVSSRRELTMIVSIRKRRSRTEVTAKVCQVHVSVRWQCPFLYTISTHSDGPILCGLFPDS